MLKGKNRTVVTIKRKAGELKQKRIMFNQLTGAEPGGIKNQNQELFAGQSFLKALSFCGPCFFARIHHNWKILWVCKQFLQRQYGKDALKSYEFREVKWNESRAILKADVSIHKRAPITDPGGDVDVVGTAVFYLEDAEDDINVVDLQFQ